MDWKTLWRHRKRREVRADKEPDGSPAVFVWDPLHPTPPVCEGCCSMEGFWMDAGRVWVCGACGLPVFRENAFR